MTTAGSYTPDPQVGAADDQQIIQFTTQGANLVLELENAAPATVDLSYLIVPPQTLTLNGTDLSITGGNTVDLSGLATSTVELCDAFGQPIPTN